MAFARQQAGRGVQANPAGAGQIDLAPGMQIGEVGLRAAGAVQRAHVRLELDQVTRHEARRQPQMAQGLHQQPAGIAARPGAARQRFFRRLHAGLHADQVADFLVHLLVQSHQKIHRALLAHVHPRQEFREQRRGLVANAVRRQFAGQHIVIGEGELLGVGFQEEIERVVDRHLGDQVYGDLEFARLAREIQARQIVGERVLLPVQEVLGGFHRQRVRQDRRAAVRRGP
ncbi:hypothetical protein D3C87_1484090 [compost metagenome]